MMDLIGLCIVATITVAAYWGIGALAGLREYRLRLPGPSRGGRSCDVCYGKPYLRHIGWVLCVGRNARLVLDFRTEMSHNKVTVLN